MKEDKVSISVVQALVKEVLQETRERQLEFEKRTYARHDELETRIATTVDRMSESLMASTERLSQDMSRLTSEISEANAQHSRTEQRALNQSEKHDKLDNIVDNCVKDIRMIRDEQIKTIMTRKVAWIVGAIALSGVIGGAFTFAWWLVKALTTSVMKAGGAA